MRVFKDAEGREWELRLDIFTLGQVKSRVNIDMTKPTGANDDDEFSTAHWILQNDYIQMANVLYVVCYKQCEDRSVSDEQFGRLLVGDVFYRAMKALWEEWADFFHGVGRVDLEELIQRTGNVMAKVHQTAKRKVTQQMELLNEEAERIFDRELSSTTSDSSGQRGTTST